jgi:hypothetical protein
VVIEAQWGQGISNPQADDEQIDPRIPEAPLHRQPYQVGQVSRGDGLTKMLSKAMPSAAPAMTGRRHVSVVSWQRSAFWLPPLRTQYRSAGAEQQVDGEQRQEHLVRFSAIGPATVHSAA